MKRIILITLLIAGVSAGYGFAQMGGGMMNQTGHMMGQSMMDEQMQQSGEDTDYDSGSEYYPCQMMGSGMMGGYGMMGSGMMGRGMMGGYGMMGGGMMGRGMMGGYGMMGRGMMGYGGYGAQASNPEAYKKYQEEYQKYLDETVGIRKKLHDKKFEYFETVRKPDVKREAVLKIEKEIRDLQWELYEKSVK